MYGCRLSASNRQTQRSASSAIVELLLLCYTIGHFINTWSFCLFSSSSRPSEIKNSAVVDKLCNATIPRHLELTMTAIKIGAIGINQGHW